MLRQAKKVSVTDSSHRIDLSEQNKLMRDEELRKAERLSNVNGPTVQIWACVSTKMTYSFGILQHLMRIGK